MPADNAKSSASPQGYEYAGFGLRFLAYWVDYLILFPLGILIQALLGQSPLAVFGAQTLQDLEKIQSSSNPALAFGVSMLLAVAYYFVFWVNYDGATPGKKLVGIKIVRENGDKMTYPVAIVRYIGLLLSCVTLLFFGLGFLWVIWDKKKQALHDKIAGTLVVKSGTGHLVWAILLTLLTMIFMLMYFGAAMVKGFSLARRDIREHRVSDTYLQERLQENADKDKDKILSFAPSSCGLSVPVPKTTDTYKTKERKWLYEEVPLDPNNFYVLDKDVYSTKVVQGAFIGYKDAGSRLGGSSFSVAYPGLNIYCVDNSKNYTLDEYASLALANKNFRVTTQNKTYWGEVELIPVVLEGKDQTGKEIKDLGYIGVTGDTSKLLYIRLWTVEESDPQKEALDEDLNVIVRNLRYRNSSGTGAGRSSGPLNSNVIGVSTDKASSAKE